MPQILIADNDRQVNDLLTSLLRLEGWAVESVFDGEAALDYLQGHPVRLLVCDLDMPRLDGFSLVQALSEVESPPAVVVVTGYTDPIVRSQLEACGAVRDVWIKPFDLDAFCGAVRRVLESPSRVEADAAPSDPDGEGQRPDLGPGASEGEAGAGA